MPEVPSGPAHSFHLPRLRQCRKCLSLCDPVDCGPPGSSVHGILQARILEWVAISFSRGSSRPRDQTLVSCISGIGRQVLYHGHHLGGLISSSDPIQNRGEMEPKEMEWCQTVSRRLSQGIPQTCSSQGLAL